MRRYTRLGVKLWSELVNIERTPCKCELNVHRGYNHVEWGPRFATLSAVPARVTLTDEIPHITIHCFTRSRRSVLQYSLSAASWQYFVHHRSCTILICATWLVVFWPIWACAIWIPYAYHLCNVIICMRAAVGGSGRHNSRNSDGCHPRLIYTNTMDWVVKAIISGSNDL